MSFDPAAWWRAFQLPNIDMSLAPLSAGGVLPAPALASLPGIDPLPPLGLEGAALGASPYAAATGTNGPMLPAAKVIEERPRKPKEVKATTPVAAVDDNGFSVPTGGADIYTAIDEIAGDPNIALAMKLAVQLESGGRADAVGDNGQSHGFYQIYQAAHGKNITPEQSRDARASTKYMLPEFQAAYRKVPAEMWRTNPMQAAALTAFYAERPAKMYDQGNIQAGWAKVQQPRQRAATGRVWDWFGGNKHAISGNFGDQDGPYPGDGHRGADIAAPHGTNIMVPVDAIVTQAGELGGGYGYGVILKMADGTSTVIGHMSRVDVRAGETLRAGTYLGASGGTPGTPGAGKSTGAHVHFETRDAAGRPFDPRTRYRFGD